MSPRIMEFEGHGHAGEAMQHGIHVRCSALQSNLFLFLEISLSEHGRLGDLVDFSDGMQRGTGDSKQL